MYSVSLAIPTNPALRVAALLPHVRFFYVMDLALGGYLTRKHNLSLRRSLPTCFRVWKTPANTQIVSLPGRTVDDVHGASYLDCLQPFFKKFCNADPGPSAKRIWRDLCRTFGRCSYHALGKMFRWLVSTYSCRPPCRMFPVTSILQSAKSS